MSMIKLLVGIGCAIAITASYGASDWPAKPVRIVTGSGTGSSTDILARMIAEELHGKFQQPFIVENRPGASGILAAENVAKSPPDGYTLFLTTNTENAANAFLFKKLPYDPIGDFTAIGKLCFTPFALVVSSQLPVNSASELIAYAQANDRKLSYAYSNSTGQVAGAAFVALTRMDANAVPYKTTPQVLTDLVGGHVSFAIVDLAGSNAHTTSGRLRNLAIASEQRSRLAPVLPTIAESAKLPEFGVTAWAGLVGPAGLPQSIVRQINAQLRVMLNREDVVRKLVALGMEPAPDFPEEFASFLKGELIVWGRKVREAGIQPQ